MKNELFKLNTKENWNKIFSIQYLNLRQIRRFRIEKFQKLKQIRIYSKSFFIFFFFFFIVTLVFIN